MSPILERRPVLGSEIVAPTLTLCLAGRCSGKGELLAIGVHHNRVAIVEVAGEQPYRQRMDDALLNRAAERTRAIDRVEADIGEAFSGGGCKLHGHVALGQSLAQVA